MKKFLLEHYEEVYDMYSIQWNERDYGKAMKEDGKLEATFSIIKNMLSMKIPYTNIAKATNTTIKDVKRIANENNLFY